MKSVPRRSCKWETDSHCPSSMCCGIFIQHSKCLHVKNPIWCPANLKRLFWVINCYLPSSRLSVAAESGFALQQVREESQFVFLDFWLVNLVDAKRVGLELE